MCKEMCNFLVQGNDVGRNWGVAHLNSISYIQLSTGGDSPEISVMWEARVAVLHFVTCPGLFPDLCHCPFLWPFYFYRLAGSHSVHQSPAQCAQGNWPLFFQVLEQTRSSSPVPSGLVFPSLWLRVQKPEGMLSRRTSREFSWPCAEKDNLFQGHVLTRSVFPSSESPTQTVCHTMFWFV